MLRRMLALCVAVAAGLLNPALATAEEVVFSNIYASAMDQPELYAALTDNGVIVADGGQPFTDPDTQYPALFEAFVDTGASGFVISHITATGAYGMTSLGLGAADYVGTFDEVGIGGAETGNITRSGFGVKVYNVTPGMAESIDLDAHAAHYDTGKGLWVRQADGVGEVVQIPIPLMPPIVDPLNIVGMPVISQHVMYMDTRAMADGQRLQTYLLDSSSANGQPPATSLSFDMYLHDFSGSAPAELATSANPMIGGIELRHTADGAQRSSLDNHWLFDTGAGSSFISFQRAKELGLLTPGSADQSFADFMAGYSGPSSAIGGIGGSMINVPIVTLDEIRIRANEGVDVVWKNVDVLVMDLNIDLDANRKLEGIFGMNLLVPAVTLDTSSLDLSDMGSLGALFEQMFGETYNAGAWDDLADLLAELQGVSGAALPSSGGSLDGLPAAFSVEALLEMLGNSSARYFDAIVFDATDSGHVQLRLQTVPEPASGMLLALAGLGILRRRRRTRLD